jgi:putative addiction module CopG family antidote
MAIEIAQTTESLIQAQVDSGRYRDADEVIRKAVALLVDHDREVEEFRRSVDEAREELHRGGGEYYTPELRREMWESAMRRAHAGETPNKDVVP